MVAEDRSDEGGDPPCWAHLEHLDQRSAAGPVVFGPTDLTRLVEKLADAVVICDPSGVIAFWNDAATRLFGFTPAAGTTLDVIIPERYRERHWRGYRTVMQTGQTSYGDRMLEVPALHHDGHQLSVAFTVTLLRAAEDDHITGIAAVIRDDTENYQGRRLFHGLVRAPRNTTT